MAASKSTDDGDAIVGINVTPLVDITLVLLIIFMVTAKLLVSQALPIELPSKASSSSSQAAQEILSVALLSNGQSTIDSKPTASDEAIFDQARAAFQKNGDVRAVVKVDTSVPHGRVVHALDLLRRAGVTKMTFAK